jgi:hypothetical protein
MNTLSARAAKNLGTARLLSIRRSFSNWPAKASDGVRQLLVVEVAPLVNELSLLLRCLLLAALLFRGLLFSCHIVLLLSCFQVVTTRYCVPVSLVD